MGRMQNIIWDRAVVSKAVLTSVLLHVVVPVAASGALLNWLLPSAKELHTPPVVEVQARAEVVTWWSEEPLEIEVLMPLIPEPELNPMLEEIPRFAPELPVKVPHRADYQTLDQAPSARVEASPDPQASPPPAYPRAAKRQRYEGQVLIWVAVGIEGTVQALGIEKSSGYRSLDQAALSAISRWDFIPALEEGRPVPGRTEVLISFQLID